MKIEKDIPLTSQVNLGVIDLISDDDEPPPNPHLNIPGMEPAHEEFPDVFGFGNIE